MAASLGILTTDWFLTCFQQSLPPDTALAALDELAASRLTPLQLSLGILTKAGDDILHSTDLTGSKRVRVARDHRVCKVLRAASSSFARPDAGCCA